MGEFPVGFLILAVVGLLGLFGTMAVAPLIMQISNYFEAFGAFFSGIVSFTGRPGLTRLGCIGLTIGVFGGCLLLMAIVIGQATCSPDVNSAFCRLIGR